MSIDAKSLAKAAAAAATVPPSPAKKVLPAAPEAEVSAAPEPVAKEKKHKPKSVMTHPPYAEMITEAISELRERSGSSFVAIKKAIYEQWKKVGWSGSLPATACMSPHGLLSQTGMKTPSSDLGHLSSCPPPPLHCVVLLPRTFLKGGRRSYLTTSSRWWITASW